MPSGVRIFTVGDAAGHTGWQTMVQALTTWLDDPATCVIIRDCHVETSASIRRGVDSLRLYMAYLTTSPAVRLQYRCAILDTAQQSAPTAYAEQIDALYGNRAPIFVHNASTVPRRDVQTGKQVFYIYLDKQTNPSHLRLDTALFVGDPVTPIVPGATGMADLYDSHGDYVGTEPVRNISLLNAWAPGDRAIVVLDISAVAPAVATYMAIPQCCP